MIITEKHIHILQKAEELFAQNGYEGTTVRDIATAADVNLAMISYYFGSKEKLIEVLFKERMEATKLRMEAVVNNPSILPFQKLEILIDQYIERVFERQDFYKVMLAQQMLQKNDVIISFMKQYKLSYANLIDEVLQAGRRMNHFTKKEIDTLLLLTSMTGTVMHTVVNKEYYREFNKHSKLKDEDFDLLLKQKLSRHVKNIFKVTLGYEQ
jgi:AcrR family transcriptional regulator